MRLSALARFCLPATGSVGWPCIHSSSGVIVSLFPRPLFFFLQERDLERSEVAKATMEAEESENNLNALRNDMDRYR